jgi:N-methyl-L-tryptophan oxidase
LVKEFVRKYLHQVCDKPQRSELCFYTMSPDQHFIIDEVKDLPGAFWAGGFSGHGFKFSSLIGKVLAEKITKARTRFPVEFLSSQRLT